MRVLIAAECFLPAMNGVTNSILRTLDHLDAQGHDVIVLAPGPGPTVHQLATGRHVTVERMPGVESSWYPSLSIGLATTARIERVIARYRPDVVHLAAPVMLGRAAAIAAARLGVPAVALFQTDLSGFARSYGLGFADRVIWSWLRRIHNGVDLTLAPTPTTASQLRGQGFRRVGVWGRGVDHAQFDPSRRCAETRRSFGVVDDEILVGYVGRLAPEKQIDRLMAIADLPRVKVAIIGSGPDAKRLASLLPHAHFAGFRGGTDLGRCVASLDVFAHTGPHETYCQTVQEAMAAGVAVVAPNAGGPVDLIDSGTNGILYDHSDPTALRSAVSKLVSDASLRRRLAKYGRTSVAGRSWEALGDQLITHYERAIDLSGPTELRPATTQRSHNTSHPAADAA